ncbi:toprim domain-containing protein [Sphingosinicellaceae bacterium]|nr:toprim domain-containing protein [Sphingosinicellaceae bacterium]
MSSPAADLAERLACDAEAVCRHYLPNGRRAGRYWLVGDVAGTPGRSLYVRLSGPANVAGAGSAGKWTDAHTGEHGDLLDLIAANRRLTCLRDTLDEARDFLRMPRPEVKTDRQPVPVGSPAAARRLWAMGKPLPGTIAETYIRQRGITAPLVDVPLRFHSRCYYRDDDGDNSQTWPALLAAVTDAEGAITGVHRTWLNPTGGKAPVASARRAMGSLLGNGVRFGRADVIIAIGEGLETMLSLRSVFPTLPMVAALSTAHLGAFDPPAGLRRIYLAADRDNAGDHAAGRLGARAEAMGIEAIRLLPTRGDFNDDIRAFGADAMRTALRPQLAPEDVDRLIVL